MADSKTLVRIVGCGVDQIKVFLSLELDLFEFCSWKKAYSYDCVYKLSTILS